MSSGFLVSALVVLVVGFAASFIFYKLSKINSGFFFVDVVQYVLSYIIFRLTVVLMVVLLVAFLVAYWLGK